MSELKEGQITFMCEIAIAYFSEGYEDGLRGNASQEGKGESYYIGYKQGARHGGKTNDAD